MSKLVLCISTYIYNLYNINVCTCHCFSVDKNNPSQDLSRTKIELLGTAKVIFLGYKTTGLGKVMIPICGVLCTSTVRFLKERIILLTNRHFYTSILA